MRPIEIFVKFCYHLRTLQPGKSLILGVVVLAAVGAASFLLPLAEAHAKDVAICVGINRYPHLSSSANLEGCVNDARLFARKLEQIGFQKPSVLADAQATKAAILSKIASLKPTLRNGDRIVIYFAGHGTLDGDESVILPSDATDPGEAHDIRTKDLYAAVKSLGGDSIQKTIVLDSCHSGGMVRGIAGLRGFRHLRPRFYVRKADLNRPGTRNRSIKRWQETDVNGGDNLAGVVGDTNSPGSGGICYFTAAQKNEGAQEGRFGDEPHGLFTYYFVRALDTKHALWKSVSAEVSGKVAADSSNEQKPQLYPSFAMDMPVFGGPVSTSAEPLSLEQIYNLSKPDPDAVSIKRYMNDPDPERAPVPLGSRNWFEITIGQDGYLVVIGRDPGNEIDILCPRADSKTLESASVHAGQRIRIPNGEGTYLHPDVLGSDSVKAILFTSERAARAFVRPFQGTGDQGLTLQAASRAWREFSAGNRAAAADSFFTSEITTLIVDAAKAD